MLESVYRHEHAVILAAGSEESEHPNDPDDPSHDDHEDPARFDHFRRNYV